MILAEAKAQNDAEKIDWCYKYIEKIRKITMEKFDNISVQIMTYFEAINLTNGNNFIVNICKFFREICLVCTGLR